MPRLGVVLVCLAVAGCGPEPDAPSNGDVRDRAAVGSGHAHGDSGTTGGVEFHEGYGTILWHEPGRIYINHEEIPGFMDAMAMGFDVRDSVLIDDAVQPGVSVEFRVVVEAGTFYVDQIHPAAK